MKKISKDDLATNRLPDGVLSAFCASLPDSLLEGPNHTRALQEWIRLRQPVPEKAKRVDIDRIEHYAPPSLSGFVRALYHEKAQRKAQGRRKK